MSYMIDVIARLLWTRQKRVSWVVTGVMYANAV